ncbi:hypothetical protein B0H16DRAFT_1389668 [Mycena metata]|uniref:F-box domain-containing protein n=1 Tax=Mycena metata TaxID=1033252 RepID=A0AAD7MFQ8_9AGAR|nr:hypothetical protein B0H16DRAFT_1389668 [Mycena metata]
MANIFMFATLDHRTLPGELWLEIFAHIEESPYDFSYAPFQPLPGLPSPWATKSAYASVVLVCRNWHAWAIGMLWRDLKFYNTRSTQVNDSSMNIQRKYAKWVQSVVLPYSSTVTKSSTVLSTKMLELYRSLQILVRPRHSQSPFQGLLYDFGTTCPPLLSLRRLVWWNNADASRTGGINSLMDVLSAAPNLEYLFVKIEPSQITHLNHTPLLQIRLMRLRTLRLRAVLDWDTMLGQILTLPLPALEFLILDAAMLVADARTTVMWETLGPRLKVVEFGKGVNVMSCLPTLQTCPSLRELNYHISTTAPPEAGPDIVYPSLTSIGVHMGDIRPAQMKDIKWEFLEQHFNALVGGMFPNLRRLRIFGVGEQMFAHTRFRALRERLTAEGYGSDAVGEDEV